MRRHRCVGRHVRPVAVSGGERFMGWRVRPLALGLLAGCAGARDAPPVGGRGDYAVYAAVMREPLGHPRRGEHGLLCESEELASTIAVVDHTQPLYPASIRRDSAAAAELKGEAVTLLPKLRALDRQPRRALVADSFGVVPVHLVPLPTITYGDNAVPGDSGMAPPVVWFSRVAYSADRAWALVYAGKMCSERSKEEAEPGAYAMTVLVPLRWQTGAWVVRDSVFLDIE